MILDSLAMAAVGNNYAKRNEKPSLADFNKAWSNTRKKAIQQGQQLRSNLTTVFSTTTAVSQQQTSSAIQGSYSSTASAMARVNILV